MFFATLQFMSYLFDDMLYIHPSNDTCYVLISFQLTGNLNYAMWSQTNSDCLLVKNKLCFIDSPYTRESVVKSIVQRWDCCNVAIKGGL